MQVYLAGPINGRDDVAVHGWRERAKVLLAPHTTLDPMDRDYRGIEDQNVSEIVEGDKADILRSDVVLAFCDMPSVGTSMEIHYAWTFNRRVYTVVPEGSMVSPWLRYHSRGIYPRLDEAIQALKGQE